MPVADVNGHDVYFEDSGGDGPAVIFSHGFLMDHEMFAPQVEALAGEFRTVTWDERGFGATPATGPFSYWDLAGDCLGLLDHLHIDAAVLAGMSQGGFLSLRAALQAPQRVLGLALIDTQAGTENPATAEAYEALGRTFIDQGPEPVQDVIAAIILGQAVDAGPWFRKWAGLDRKGFEYAFRCLMDRDDISDRMGEIVAPAVIFHGSDDAAIPLERAEFLRDHLRGCRDLVVVPGAGHASNLSHPDAVTPKLRDFVATVG
jgi:3-oxoadipate enol-lactonase